MKVGVEAELGNVAITPTQPKPKLIVVVCFDRKNKFALPTYSNLIIGERSSITSGFFHNFGPPLDQHCQKRLRPPLMFP